jgi:putative Mg2+ transporter-C (MgtC) family protein
VDLPSEPELALRLLLAAALGGLVGLEREVTGQTAGLRTHISVCLGAALFAVVSAYGFNEFDVPRDDTVFQVDVTRVASNVVTGVGFLGGGAIVKYGASVRGLTTAASMWVTAAVGLAVGLGSYLMALVTSAVLLVSLWGLRSPRRWIANHVAVNKQTIVVRVRSDSQLPDVVGALYGIDEMTVRSLSVHKNDEEGTTVEADISCRAADMDTCLAAISSRPEVVDVEQAG